MSYSRYFVLALLIGILRVLLVGSKTTLTAEDFDPSFNVIVAVLIAATPDLSAHRT